MKVPNSPFFSVIIVSLNAGGDLSKTIKSILEQSYNDYEIIVKDGQSTDNSIKAIPENSHIRLFVEKDNSIYDAMNQATSHSVGKYIIYLNCGDTFANQNVLLNVYDLLKYKEVNLAYGNYQRDGIVHKQPKRLSTFSQYRTALCHQTIFFNGLLMRNNYSYDTDYHFYADYDLELKICKNIESILYMDVLICNYLGKGVSEQRENHKRLNHERKDILKRRFSKGERFLCFIKFHLTFPWIRSKMMRGNCPNWIKAMYQNIVNFINYNNL